MVGISLVGPTDDGWLKLLLETTKSICRQRLLVTNGKLVGDLLPTHLNLLILYDGILMVRLQSLFKYLKMVA